MTVCLSSCSICFSLHLSVFLSLSPPVCQCWSCPQSAGLSSVCLSSSSSWFTVMMVVKRRGLRWRSTSPPQETDILDRLTAETSERIGWDRLMGAFNPITWLLIDRSIEWLMENSSGWWTPDELLEKAAFCENEVAEKSISSAPHLTVWPEPGNSSAPGLIHVCFNIILSQTWGNVVAVLSPYQNCSCRSAAGCWKFLLFKLNKVLFIKFCGLLHLCVDLDVMQ